MKKYTIFLLLALLTLLVVGSAQAEDRAYFEVFDCEDWKDNLYVGDQIGFQHGIGFGDYETAVAERAGQEAFFFIDGEPLGPVSYTGLNEHAPDFYGDTAYVNWDVKPGTHTIQSYWTHENEGYPGDSCTFKANKVPKARDLSIFTTGERLIIPNGEGEMTYPANQPFHIQHGFVWNMVNLGDRDKDYPQDADLKLFFDGELLLPDTIQYQIVNTTDENVRYKYKWYIYNFPEGLTGVHSVEMEYWFRCADFLHTTCNDPFEMIMTLHKYWIINFVE